MPECSDGLRPALATVLAVGVASFMIGVVVHAACYAWAMRRRRIAELTERVVQICYGFAVDARQAADGRLFVGIADKATGELRATLSVAWRSQTSGLIEYTLGDRIVGAPRPTFALDEVLRREILPHITRIPERRGA